MRKNSSEQVGGTHYSSMKHQPIDFCFDNMTMEEVRGAMKLSVMKYIWRNKGSRIEDLEKAKHFLEMWIEQENINE